MEHSETQVDKLYKYHLVIGDVNCTAVDNVSLRV